MRYRMLLFVIVVIFVAGLMVGRTPEYVGKKIEAKASETAMLAIDPSECISAGRLSP